jgi:hypothetical protein
LNINGKDGPTLKHIFTCEGCKYLSNSVLGGWTGKYPFKCFHDELANGYNTSFDLMMGNIGEELITPENCPYLIKRMRTEKLKEINEYRRTEENIA